MGSRVAFEIDGAQQRTAELVFPGEANLEQGKISILTPIGAALIGLSPGQMMVVKGVDGRPHKLKVLSVRAPRRAL